MLKHGSNTYATQHLRSHSALQVCISVRTWHLAWPQHCSTSSRRTIERGAERHRRRRLLPKRQQKQSDRHAEMGQGASFCFLGLYSILDTCIFMVKVCAVVAQPGQTKELQSVQLERGLQIIESPANLKVRGGEKQRRLSSIVPVAVFD